MVVISAGSDIEPQLASQMSRLESDLIRFRKREAEIDAQCVLIITRLIRLSLMEFKGVYKALKLRQSWRPKYSAMRHNHAGTLIKLGRKYAVVDFGYPGDPAVYPIPILELEPSRRDKKGEFRNYLDRLTSYDGDDIP
jgi:hypothetical protein